MNDQYDTYSVDELIGDERFIDWVLNPTGENDQFWQKWISKNPEHEAKVMEARSILKNMNFRKMDTQGMAPKIWDRISNDLQAEKPESGSGSKIIRLITRTAAAAAVLLLLIFNWGQPAMTNIEISPGMAHLHQLPDQSRIQINDGSSISYDGSRFEKMRDIYLQGEAFFEVTKGSPFTVHTDNGEVQVLGTSFNIFSHGKALDVICKTGKVQVTSDDDSVILLPGEKASLNSENQLIKTASEMDISWLAGTYQYEDASLILVTNELERQFNLRVHLPESLSDLRYTGFFLDNDLEQALNSVFWPLKLKYEKEDNEIFVSREN